jgi:outer membrane protein assembly factor BamB
MADTCDFGRASLVGAGLGLLLAAAGGMSRAQAIDWTTYAFDNQRTGYNPAETTLGTKNVGGLKLGWSTDVGGPITTQPLVATGVVTASGKKDLVYVGTQDGDAVALDRTTGKVVWRTTLGAVTLPCGNVFGVTGTPVLKRARHALYVAAGDGKLHALNEATGAELAGWPVTYVTTLKVDVTWAGLTLVGDKL